MLITDQIYVLDKNGNKIPFAGASSITQSFEIVEPVISGTTNIILNDQTYSYFCTLGENQRTTFNIDLSKISINENTSVIFELKLQLTEITTFSLPSNLNWENGIEPVFDRPGTYFLCFRTDDQGSSWLAGYQGFWSV